MTCRVITDDGLLLSQVCQVIMMLRFLISSSLLLAAGGGGVFASSEKEMTVKVEAAQEECFFETLNKGDTLDVDYQVGQRMTLIVDFFHRFLSCR